MLATRNTIQDACEMLVESDRLIARALSIIGTVECERTTGLPTEMMLVLGARRTGADAYGLVNAAATLRGMPSVARAFCAGELSWSQVRAITGAVRSVDAAGREQIDRLIAFNAPRLGKMDPDELLSRVDDAVAGLRPDLVRAREDRHITREYLSVQGRLDGSCSILGEAGPESAATIMEALDAAADRPVAADEEGPSRSSQHMDAFVSICEQSLNGGSTTTTRPRPRLIATVDVESLAEGADSQAARILWSLAGRPAPITPLATEVLVCDASVIPVVFQSARPVAVGDAQSPISSKLRTALVARDGGCRFPGCAAPVAWCDAHHIRARIHHGPTVIDNLMLCAGGVTG
ncbi:MAG TPA: DUF222 domain-containing protein [Actinomycetota bacterium]|nr:DUF222 domain-containing protein [Actinomycetota bacterium]